MIKAQEIALAQGLTDVETLGRPRPVSIYTPARLSNCDPLRVLKDEGARVLARVEGAGFHDPLELEEGAQ